MVSHDRYLVERACDTVVALLGDGKITHLPGGIDEYLARRAAAGRAVTGLSAAPAPARAARPSASNAAEQRAARKEAARLERRMAALADREERLHEQLAAAATDPARLLELDPELKAVLAERPSVEVGLAGGRRARRGVSDSACYIRWCPGPSRGTARRAPGVTIRVIELPPLADSTAPVTAR